MFQSASPERMGVRSEGIVRFLDEMKEKLTKVLDSFQA